MRKKTVSLTVALLCPIFLMGCFGGTQIEEQPITFDTFNLSIDNTFESIPPSLVENKQIINKVLRSFKIPSTEGFDKNLVITKSTIDPSLSFDEFATANESKLRTQLVGYISGPKEIHSFTCVDDQEITGVYAQFTVTDTFFEGTSEYYIHQYQFVANKFGYIISYASDSEGEEKLFKNILKSLECDQNQP